MPTYSSSGYKVGKRENHLGIQHCIPHEQLKINSHSHSSIAIPRARNNQFPPLSSSSGRSATVVVWGFTYKAYEGDHWRCFICKHYGELHFVRFAACNTGISLQTHKITALYSSNTLFKRKIVHKYGWSSPNAAPAWSSRFFFFAAQCS